MLSSSWTKAAVAFVALAGFGSSARAAQLVLEQGVNSYAGNDDTSIYENRTLNAGGGYPYIYAGVTQDASKRRALIRFDLAGLPSGSIIQSVELRLVVDQSRPGTEPYTLHRITRHWGEGAATSQDPGGLGAPAATGDATWLSAEEGITSWTVAGGDYQLTSSASTSVGTLGTSATFTGAGMVQDVQAWLNQPATNHGWMLIGNEATTFNARRFHSSEGNTLFRPRLTIQYTSASSVDNWVMY